ncbi:MAG: carboxypeptidase regulatory-like domain-containing protein [Acidobacteriia bacterium]|nr:carboxypeptidase regulatory-like domain-containing protein [Terriglobia bacterium]
MSMIVGIRRIYGFVLLGLVWAILLSLSSSPAYGQGAATFSSLSGEVTDQNGGALPRAKVTAVNNGTGLSESTQTDDNGHFNFVRLPAGSYRVVVEAPAFKKWEAKEVTLAAGREENIRISMAVGDVQQTVEVKGEELQISTTEAVVGSSISPLQIQDLPLNQRSFTALVTQQPGLVQITNTAGATVLGAATNTGSYISGNGLMGTSVGYLVDGVNITNGTFTAPGTASAGDMPGVEAISEFQVLTHGYSAAFGGASGSVVSFATKTGTNSLHGSVYEFLRNDKLDAREFFNDAASQAKPPFKRNQFGGSLGGPIKKDKTFFFVNYEALRQRLTKTEVAFVPTDCARNSGLGGSGVGCPGGVPDPVSITTSLSPLTIQQVAIPAAMQPILALYPLPNGPILSDWVGEYIFANPKPTRQDFGIVNITHALTDRDSLSARYSITDADASEFFHLPGFDFMRKDRNQNLMMKWSHLGGSHWVNTLSVSFLRNFIFADTSTTTPLLPSQYTGLAARQTIGAISIGAGSAGTASGSLTFLGLDDAAPFRLAKNNFPVNEDAVYTIGKHTIKVGGLINRFQWNWKSATITGGSYTFNSVNDFLAANTNFFLIHRDGPDSIYGLRTTLMGWYAEDAWRIRPNLTLTYGLRHDFQVPVLEDVNNRLGNWQNPTDTQITVGQPYHNYSLKQFQPRLGIAYDPFNNSKTVVRAGFGVFNDFVDYAGNGQGQLQWNAPQPVLNSYFGQPIWLLYGLGGVIPPLAFPTCDSDPLGRCTSAAGTYYGLVTGVLEPMNSPTSVQWHAEIERQLPSNFTFTLNYSGSNSYHIPRKQESNYNLPCGTDANGLPIFPPACVSVGTAAPAINAIGFSLYSKRFDATANYNAVTFALNRKFGSMLTMSSNYTFAKALSQSDSVNSGNVIVGVAQGTQYPAMKQWDRAESLFSIRHRFTENLVFDLPVGKGRKFMSNAAGIQQAILGGWQITSMGTFQSGTPFSVLAGVGITGVGDTIDYPDRPNLVSSSTTTGNINGWLNERAYALQDAGNLGSAPRNSARGPNFKQMDFGIGKDFTLTERVGMRFRLDMFNILNHPNFGLPFNQIYVPAPQFASLPSQAQLDALPCALTAVQSLTTSCNPQAGVISSTVGNPRQMQVSLKLTF